MPNTLKRGAVRFIYLGQPNNTQDFDPFCYLNYCVLRVVCKVVPSNESVDLLVLKMRVL